MSSVNKVILIGRAVRDPDIRSTQSGKQIASFSLATSESWKDRNGERQEKSEFHRIAVMNEGLVGVVKNYVKKGTQLYLEGQLQTRKWQGNDGQEKYTTEVVLSGFSAALVLLGKREGGAGYSEPAMAEELDDEILF